MRIILLFYAIEGKELILAIEINLRGHTSSAEHKLVESLRLPNTQSSVARLGYKSQIGLLLKAT